MDAGHPLLITAALIGLVSLGRASHVEYQVDAVFHPRESVKVPGESTPEAQKALDEKLKKGFSSSIKVKVFASDDYKELPTILPSWGRMKAAQRINGWNEDSFFSIGSGRATMGDSETLARYIPLGQRLLLTSEASPSSVFKALTQKAQDKGGASLVAAKEGVKEIVLTQGRLQEDIVSSKGRTKLAEFRMTNGGSLEIKRFHPSGRLLTTETWTQARDLSALPAPDPLWDGWQKGAWVLDERNPDEALHKKWQGYGQEPSTADSKPIKNMTFRLTWLAPGLAMMLGGAAFLAYFSLKRKPQAKT